MATAFSLDFSPFMGAHSGLLHTHRPFSSSFLGFILTILEINPNKGTTKEPMGTVILRFMAQGVGFLVGFRVHGA